jgi:hypothetical protein
VLEEHLHPPQSCSSASSGNQSIFSTITSAGGGGGSYGGCGTAEILVLVEVLVEEVDLYFLVHSGTMRGIRKYTSSSTFSRK